MGTEPIRCSRCIMPSTYPGISFGQDGTCSICQHFDRTLGRWYLDERMRVRAGERLSRIVESARKKKREYDCIVPTSGGRDSLYVLHLSATKLNLRPLVFTVDNGFWAPEARQNLEAMVTALGLSHLVYRPDQIRPLAGLFFRETRDFCAPCNFYIFHKTAEVAGRYGIPLVMMGGCQRLDRIMPIAPDPWQFRRVMQSNCPRDLVREHRQLDSHYFRYYLRGGRRVQPLDFIDWNHEDRRRVLESRYGIRVLNEHEDCLAHETVSYLSSRTSRLRRHGMTFATLKYSQLVRNSVITRDEALERVASSDPVQPPASLVSVMEAVGVGPNELEGLLCQSPDVQRYRTLPGIVSGWWRQVCYRHGLGDSRFFPDL